MTRTGAKASLPPVIRQVTVPLDPASAFRRFTAEMATWWPLRTHSVGQAHAETVVFETGVGGRIVERLTDGTEHEWGRVTIWEPPGRVVFTWYPGRGPETAQEVEVIFAPARGGTAVRITHRGWETLGPDAVTTRDEYERGWMPVLDRYTALA